MASHVTITAEFSNRTTGDIEAATRYATLGSKHALFRAFLKEFWAVFTGRRATMRACIASACASTYYTCTWASAVSGTDTATIGGTALVAESSPVDQDDFDIGTTDATMAANLAAAINAHTTLQKIVRASASAAVVTVTSIYPGPIGNFVTTTKSGNGLAVNAAALAAGASDAPVSGQFGYTPAT